MMKMKIEMEKEKIEREERDESDEHNCHLLLQQ